MCAQTTQVGLLDKDQFFNNRQCCACANYEMQLWLDHKLF